VNARSCPACAGSSIHVWLSDLVHHGPAGDWHYQLLGCEVCGLGFVDPEPSSAQAATFYSADYHPYAATDPAPEVVARSFKYRVARMRHAPGRLDAALGFLVEQATGKTVSYSLGMPLQLPLHARIFELGYGAGTWLLSMGALGYRELHGFDIAPNDQHRARLIERGIHVTSGNFLEQHYPEAYFECVRLEHVFEHLCEPLRVLEKVHTMLKPGGLVVMNLPCIDSWSARLSMRHFPHLDLPRHLYHHTQRSLEAMLRVAGFTRIRDKSYADVAALAGTVNGLLLERSQHTIPNAVWRSLAPAYKLACELSGKGDLVTLVATRS
jgi:SAM-dependent methyltransferase